MGREPDVGQQLIELIRGMGRQAMEDILDVREGIDIVVPAGEGECRKKPDRGFNSRDQPVIESETGDVPVIGRVVRNEGQVVDQGCGGDQQV
jgi:hypothetical protein